MRVLGDERLGGCVNSFARGVYMDFTISVVLVKKRTPKNLTRYNIMSAAPSGFARFSNTTIYNNNNMYCRVLLSSGVHAALCILVGFCLQ